MGIESEVKAVWSLGKLNLEGMAFKVDESDNNFRVSSNSKCLNDSDSPTTDPIEFMCGLAHSFTIFGREVYKDNQPYNTCQDIIC